MLICMNKFYFTITMLKSGFVANVKKRREPGFGMLHHIIGCPSFSKDYSCLSLKMIQKSL